MSANAASLPNDVTTTAIPRQRSRWRTALRTLTRNKLALVGTIIAIAYVLLGIFGPMLAPYPYESQDLMNTLKPPLTPGHVLGTDDLGRDMLSRLLTGIRISLVVGFGVTLVSLVIGSFFGILAGYYGGKVDTVISAFIEFTWGFPLILIAVILTGAIGPGLKATMLAIGLINWAGFARIIRAEVMTVSNREFVEAAKSIGANDLRLVMRHVVPNVLAPALVMTSYYVALAIIVEAGLSFIGMGAQPPLPSLGVMIASGRNFITLDHWICTIPGLAIVTIVMGLNLLGDGLRDIFDPRVDR